MGFVPSSEATPKAEAAALRALELDSSLAEPLTHQYDEAIEAFHEALRISPDLPFVWLVLAGSYHLSGKFDDAIEAEGSLMAALGDSDGQRMFIQKYE